MASLIVPWGTPEILNSKYETMNGGKIKPAEAGCFV
jgi:hypothetical protein